MKTARHLEFILLFVAVLTACDSGAVLELPAKDVFVDGVGNDKPRWTSYDVPDAGANLILNVKKGTGVTCIKTSGVRLDDTSDNVAWTAISKDCDLHVYHILGVNHRHEWVAITGQFDRVTTGGTTGKKKSSSAEFQVGVINVELTQYVFLRPTPGDSLHPNAVYVPIVTKGDKVYYKFKLRIRPHYGLKNVRYRNVTVSLLDGATVKSHSAKTFSGPGYGYPNLTMVGDGSGTQNIAPLSIPDTVQDNKTYTLRVDVTVNGEGVDVGCLRVWEGPVKTDFKAVEVGRTISGEDNGSDAAMDEVQATILNRWSFPVIANGHAFTQSVLRGGHTSIYDLATDPGIFNGYPAQLANTVQYARELGRTILANPNSANGEGPIYFHAASATSTPCKDAVAVGLLLITATYGNKYYSPANNPNTWTTLTIKNAYDANPNDSLEW